MTSTRVGRVRDPGVNTRYLEAAAAHIAEHGLQNLSINQLSVQVHAGKASFYLRWPDTDHFLADLVRYLRADPCTAPRANTILFAAGSAVRALLAEDNP